MLKRAWQWGPLVLVTLLVVSWAPAPLVTVALAQDSMEEADEPEMLDEIVLSTGRVVRGRLISENDSEIVFEIVQEGLPPYRVTYPRSDVQKIVRDVADAPTGIARPGADDGDKDTIDESIDPDAALIYAFRMTGDFGSDVSQTPLRAIFDDVDATFDDAIPNPQQGGPETIVDPSTRDKHIVLITIDTNVSEQGFQEIFRAEEILPLFEQEIHQRGRRIVFVVDQAINGAAFLPWVSPEMYFTPDGIMYFTSNFDEFKTGDTMVDEKLIGANLGTAEGLTILGGYDPEVAPPIIRAMARGQYWLSVQWNGAIPRVTMRPPRPTDAADGWEVLTDSGMGEFDDPLPKEIRDPNDQLRLRADTAFRLAVSKGTVRDRQELLFLLGIARNYHYMDHEAEEILGAWRRDLNRFFTQAHPGSQRIPRGELWRDMDDVRVAGDFQDRRKARGRQMNLLGQIRSRILRVQEVVDSNGQFISQIETLIYQIQTQQQLDSENR